MILREWARARTESESRTQTSPCQTEIDYIGSFAKFVEPSFEKIECWGLSCLSSSSRPSLSTPKASIHSQRTMATYLTIGEVWDASKHILYHRLGKSQIDTLYTEHSLSHS